MRACVIVPVLYSEPQLSDTLARLVPVRDALDLEVLVVVDVPDPGWEPAARAENDRTAGGAGARALYRVGERGFGSALRLAFTSTASDVLIPFMGDGSDDPDSIPRMLERIEEGWDVVAGSRYVAGGGIRGNTAKQRLSHVYSLLMRLAGGPPIHDVSNAFKAYRRSVVESVPTVGESFDISVELTVKAALAGFRVTEIPTVWTNRELGTSNFRIGREMRRYGRWLLHAARGRLRGTPLAKARDRA